MKSLSLTVPVDQNALIDYQGTLSVHVQYDPVAVTAEVTLFPQPGSITLLTLPANIKVQSINALMQALQPTLSRYARKHPDTEAREACEQQIRQLSVPFLGREHYLTPVPPEILLAQPLKRCFDRGEALRVASELFPDGDDLVVQVGPVVFFTGFEAVLEYLDSVDLPEAPSGPPQEVQYVFHHEPPARNLPQVS